jgi:ankyrin repeat protein
MAMEQLQKLVSIQCKSPRDKMRHLITCCRLIYGALTSGAIDDGKPAQAIGADDFLPALIYVVIRSNPPHLHSNIEFICSFRSSARLQSEEGYYLTQLQSGVEFLKNCSDEDLTIRRDDFNKGVQGFSFFEQCCEAVKVGDVATVETLLSGGARVNQLSADKSYTILTTACARGHNAVVETILQPGLAADVNFAVGPRKWNALMFASHYGHYECAALLLKNGADRHLASNDARTAIDLAESAGHKDLMLLLEADPAVISLPSAAKGCHFGYIRALLKQGVNPNSFGSDGTKFSAMHAAAYCGHLDIVKELLGHPDLDLELQDGKGERALSYAVSGGHMPVVLHLLQHGADRYVSGHSGKSAIDTAAHVKNPAIEQVLRTDPAKTDLCECAKLGDDKAAKALLLQSVSPNVRSKRTHLTPLMVAAQNGHTDFAGVLVQHATKKDPVNINMATYDQGMTALMFAASNGHTKTVAFLLKTGADRSAVNSSVLTALQLAVSRGQEDCLVLLKVDPTMTCMCAAAKNNELVIVNALLEQGVSPNMTGKFAGKIELAAFTPLIAAVSHGRRDIVRRLLDAPEINLELSNPKGETALIYAAAQGFGEIVLLLLLAGASRYHKDHAGSSATVWALKKSATSKVHHEVMTLLKADPKHVKIHDLCRSGSLDYVRALLQQGVSVNAPNDDIKEPSLSSPLVAICGTKFPLKPAHLAIFNLLMNSDGLQVDAPNHLGETVLPSFTPFLLSFPFSPPPFLPSFLPRSSSLPPFLPSFLLSFHALPPFLPSSLPSRLFLPSFLPPSLLY